MFDTMMPGFSGNFEGLMNSFFGDRLRDFTGPAAYNTQLGAFGVLKPKLDLRAEEEQYVLSAEIPGVDEKDIAINVMEGVMTISGEKKEEQEQKKRTITEWKGVTVPSNAYSHCLMMLIRITLLPTLRTGYSM